MYNKLKTSYNKMEWETALSAPVIVSDYIEFQEHRKKNKKI
jgi:hypothetical protein